MTVQIKIVQVGERFGCRGLLVEPATQMTLMETRLFSFGCDELAHIAAVRLANAHDFQIIESESE